MCGRAELKRQLAYAVPGPGAEFACRFGNEFTINCSGFDSQGVNPTVFASVIMRKDFRPVVNYSVPTQVNISFTVSSILDVVSCHLAFVWDNAFISWNPEECGGIQRISMMTQNLWLPDIFVIESYVDQTPTGLTAYVSNEGRIKYKKPMRVTTICNLDIFRFPFDHNTPIGFRTKRPIYFVTNLALPIKLGFLKIPHFLLLLHLQVAIKRRPGLYVINLLVPSGFLIAIDALSFLLPVESGNRAPFKMTLLLGYTAFLLMMNDLLPASGIPLIKSMVLASPICSSGVYFALCLTLMVTSLLESVLLTYLLHMVTTQPPPMPSWLYSLVLRYITATECCNKGSQKENRGPGHNSIHLPGQKDPVALAGWEPGPGKAELNEDPQSTWAESEQEIQRHRTMDMWVKFSLALDTLLFWLYLLFMISSLITVIAL
uniref:5-hydroxytryptamine receptor 3C n=1 Tax=Vombatus ursinus TaxID=29139 RepID=A0A4X2M8W4_VOMUR